MSDGSKLNSRRDFLKSGLIMISTAALPAEASRPPQSHTTPEATHYFSEAERKFLQSAIDRLIPSDERWPGALEAGVVNYIELQMAGPWGRGELVYRHGPFRKGSKTQGYQLEYTPGELFHRSINAINNIFMERGTTFSELSAAERDDYLTKLETEEIDLDGVPSNIFFDFLWKHTVEGFFADPIYGGNRDKIAWKMIGFPGAYTDFYDLVDKHGVEYHREPAGIGDGPMHMHSKPNQGKG